MKASPDLGGAPRGAATSLDLSVVIVSYNAREKLRECLDSIFAEPARCTHEVLVVDNASADGSADMVASAFPQVRLIRSARNLGFARANNVAFAEARGRLILLLNPDTQVLDRALERLVAFMDRRPDAAVVGCRVLEPGGRLSPSTWDAFPGLVRTLLATVNLTLTSGRLWARLQPWLLARGRRPRPWLERSRFQDAYEADRETSVVNGCCLMTRREVLDRVGGLDEGFFVVGEEVDYCYRVKQAGFRIWFTADATIMHHGKQSWGASPRRLLQYYRYAYRYLRKHFGIAPAYLYRAILPPLLVLGIVIHAGWYFVAGKRAPAVAQNLRAFVTALAWALGWPQKT